ncbi:hypothetical protein C4B68_02200 [Streptomyces dengpaensis]|uniref:DUF317 domain-containing protein n=1 Tax=Streptomyces dengpaensis TaxID=2049881 RepID=A0ABM6SJG5_9ACTN|nr:hypothetical protein C4B68_02200 [Streptomyces dengpaensis]
MFLPRPALRMFLPVSAPHQLALLDLVGERGWQCQYSEGETVLRVPRADAVLSRPDDAKCPWLRVWPSHPSCDRCCVPWPIFLPQ